MVYKYFTEFNISDEELKEKIYQTLKSLNIFAPDEFGSEIIEQANPQLPVETLLQNLHSTIPMIKDIQNGVGIFELHELLRATAIKLDGILQAKMLEFSIPKLIFRIFANQMLGFEYVIAVEIIEKKLKQQLNFNYNLIAEELLETFGRNENSPKLYQAIKCAESEINRLLEYDEELNLFIESTSKFEAAIEEYIKKHVGNILLESFGRIFYEGVIINGNIIDSNLNLENPVTDSEKKEFIENLRKLSSYAMSRRLGIKRGGSRKREKFVWTNHKKISFFNTIQSLPKIKDKPVWNYLCHELFEEDFDFETIKWFRNRPIIKDLPQSLFDQAVKSWRKYDEISNIVRDEDKPRSFEFRHALILLGYPDEFKFGTLRNQYFQGQKLSKNE